MLTVASGSDLAIKLMFYSNQTAGLNTTHHKFFNSQKTRLHDLRVRSTYSNQGIFQEPYAIEYAEFILRCIPAVLLYSGSVSDILLSYDGVFLQCCTYRMNLEIRRISVWMNRIYLGVHKPNSNQYWQKWGTTQYTTCACELHRPQPYQINEIKHKLWYDENKPCWHILSVFREDYYMLNLIMVSV